MRLPHLFAFLLILQLVMGCQDTEVKEVNPTKATDTLKVHLGQIVSLSVLAPEAEEKISDIAGFGQLDVASKILGKATIGQVKSQIPGWLEAMALFEEELKDSMSSPSIDARLILMRTRAAMLKQEVDKRVVDTALINAEATAFYNAYQELGVQFNYKYGKSVEDLLNEFREEGDEMRIEARQGSTAVNPSKSNLVAKPVDEEPEKKESPTLKDTLR